ncbi:MAG TPA: hypothetical protein PKE65_00160 [Rhizobiaceae bacterium]|nr:hypothetical protein [Rhizobiaceae bacterium]
MGKVFYALLVGLVGAGIVHLAVILSLPVLATNTVWLQVVRAVPEFAFLRIDDKPQLVKSAVPDPHFAIAACRFEIDDQPVHFFADGRHAMWTLSVFNDRGEIVFGINDRIAAGRRLDVAVATPKELVELRKEVPDILSRSVIAETSARRGFAVLRVFVPDRSWRELADKYLENARCRRLEPPE